MLTGNAQIFEYISLLSLCEKNTLLERFMYIHIYIIYSYTDVSN